MIIMSNRELLRNNRFLDARDSPSIYFSPNDHEQKGITHVSRYVLGCGYIWKHGHVLVLEADWVRLCRLHKITTWVHISPMLVEWCDTYDLLTPVKQSVKYLYSILHSTISRLADPHLHLSLVLGPFRRHATLLSKSPKKLHRPALPTSPKRSGDNALIHCFLPVQIIILPNPRIDEPVRALGTKHANKCKQGDRW